LREWARDLADLRGRGERGARRREHDAARPRRRRRARARRFSTIRPTRSSGSTRRWWRRSRLRVVSDFRRADLAAGGQGAPLVPFADYILFRHPTKNRVLLNLGGSRTSRSSRRGAPPEQVIAFDTGPGNCVLDHLCRKHGIDERVRSRRRTLARAGGFPRSRFIGDPTWRGILVRKPPKSADIPK
jgi:1,6-anhydro-N-acetylmuramate kinase